ncbi:MAG: type II toxin-antitoxin system prevent-host-death family antitoxin [SAR324 cluster bacterium]|nr:type II toxin-antitoxin system prevent-host-death family antitoxin [SAR324 cluster bacterium]
MEPTKVGIREAKIHLSKYIRIVQQGKEVILTDRGHPVGKIVPIQTNEIPQSVRIQKLEEKGVLEVLPRGYFKKLPTPIPVADNIAQSFLSQDRNNDR